MSWYAGLVAFFTAAGETANLFTLILQHQYTQDADLKTAKDQLLQEWKDAYASQDKSKIVFLIQKIREASS